MQLLLTQLVKSLRFNQFPRYLFFLGILASLVISGGASALFEAGQSVSDAKLISSVTGEGDQKTIVIGLDIHLKPGWKTYWRSPGGTGYGIKIDWSGSKNVQSAELYWPAPVKFETFNFIAQGYKKEVIFPIKVTLQKKHSSLFLKGKLDYLVCDAANCIPQSKIVTLLVPDKPAKPSENAKEITTALQHVPEKNGTDLSIKSAQYIQHENAASSLRLVVFHKLPLESPEVFVEGPKHLFFDKIQSIRTIQEAKGLTSTIDIPIYKNEKRELVHTQNLVGKSLTITLESGDKAVEKTVSVIAPPASLQTTLLIYGGALVGGFILNFMPCVLPVILLKVFSLTQYGGGSPAAVRKALFFSVMGIITSFMVLGLVPITVNLLGGSFGWGMQFQEPIFLVFMMLILTLFAANFWGFYEIILPEKITSLGYEYSDKEGNIGHFLTGAFATLLATPCSAPYLGTAVTFALSRGPLDILLVFLLLGIGLSIPFILVMMFPKSATYFPKPGKWMNVFKKVLGWGFFVTMLWLFYVLTNQVSWLTALLVLGALLLLILMFWLHQKFPSYRRVLASFAVIIALFPFSLLLLKSLQERTAVVQTVNMRQVAGLIKTDLKEGKVVFVDVTADWCLTCKANEYFVLDTQRFKDLVQKNHVDFIKIDWTSKDPEVYEYLKSFDRNGIPFYTVYGPHMPYGQTLPQILTFSIVDEAVKKAK